MNRTKCEIKAKHRIELQEKNLRHVYEFICSRKRKNKMKKREDLCG